jgi:hypothetical protein
MAIDDGADRRSSGPPIDRDDDNPEPCSLRGDLLEALRRKAFEIYVNRGVASELHIANAHAFADAIVAAITVEVFDSALRGQAATSSLADLLPASPLRH